MATFKGYIVNEGCYYKILPDGNAPNNLGVGDLIVSNNGTYLIIAVRQLSSLENAQAHSEHGVSPVTTSDYTVILYNKNLTTYNFQGTYLEPPHEVVRTNNEDQLTGSVGLSADIEKFDMPDNYIYFYNLDKFIMLPLYADSVQDSMNVNFESSTPLSRSAPIYSYKDSGPRTVQVGFDLHRDLMTDINYQISNVIPNPAMNEDYVDILIKYIQSATLPVYSSANKMVNPPIVAMRLSNDIFIKGVINGSVGLVYKFPILKNGKYAVVSTSFAISETEPYSAWDVVQQGSYRGLDRTLNRKIQLK